MSEIAAAPVGESLNSVPDLLASPRKLEVLADLEPVVSALMSAHEAKRDLWLPSELLAPAADEDPDEHVARIRDRARGISPALRAAIALNLLTEEGLPHFHRILSAHLAERSAWTAWRNLWTAEEDRHGVVLQQYARSARLLDTITLERMQFEYLRRGMEVAWDRDPYRVLVYTSLQERATQLAHANTGRLAGEYEPTIGLVLHHVAQDEARHFAFYRAAFKEVLRRDPNAALISAVNIMPGIDMPGVNIPQFGELATIVRRAGIYGPRDYCRIVEEQLRYWEIDALKGLDDGGREAQERLLQIPQRLERLAEVLESRSRPKTFCLDVIFRQEFSLA